MELTFDELIEGLADGNLAVPEQGPALLDQLGEAPRPLPIFPRVAQKDVGHQSLLQALARVGRPVGVDGMQALVDGTPLLGTPPLRAGGRDRVPCPTGPATPSLIFPTAAWPQPRVTAQAEFSTDLVFKSRAHLRHLVPRLLEHRLCAFSPTMCWPSSGASSTRRSQGEVLTALRAHELDGRLLGHRVKPRMKQTWIKMYNKPGLLLRIETVINDPEEFRVRRRERRPGRRRTEWVPLRKGVRGSPPSSAIARSLTTATRGI